MDELRPLIFGVGGGVIGAFFKFWIEDLRKWQESRLKQREKELLRLMQSENGMARFSVKQGRAPYFSNQYRDLDHPENDFTFQDLGEVERLERLGLIEKIPSPSPDPDRRLYRLTGKAYK